MLPFRPQLRLIGLMTNAHEFGPYRDLLKRMNGIALMTSASGLLSWDQETNMPRRGLACRAEQLAFMSGWVHQQFTAREVGEWLSRCEEQGWTSGTPAAANIREWRRGYERQTRLPTELVEAMEKARTLGREAWVEARSKSEFSIFQPHLETILKLNRRMVDCWGYAESPYDALLDEYEPGMTAKALRGVFSELRPAVVSLLDKARERSAAIPEDYLAGEYPVANQQAFNREVAAAIGFDFDAGRIDTTTHPFCTGLTPGDCRLTTRYNESDFTQSLYGVLHEAGHGLYEQGLDPEAYGTPMGQACSLGIHESQSRLWENHVGRSPAFWEHWHERACHHFPSLSRFQPHQIAAAVNRVAPSFIRVEADEVTYDLHIILRFETELKLIEGAVEVRDLPALWNEEFGKMLGLKVRKDSDGCLQDIHWSMGGLGYFPTYTLGNLNASQLFHKALEENPDLDGKLAAGQYGELRGWLKEKIHLQGQRLLPQDLMKFATGETTRAQYHLQHLRERFVDG